MVSAINIIFTRLGDNAVVVTVTNLEDQLDSAYIETLFPESGLMSTSEFMKSLFTLLNTHRVNLVSGDVVLEEFEDWVRREE